MRGKKWQTRIGILRRELGISQADLAKRCGLSEIYLRLLESGKRPVSRKVALALSVSTGASVEWLLGKGRRYPIVEPLGLRKWKKQDSDRIHNRKLDRTATLNVAKWCAWNYAFITDSIGRIIFSAFKKNKGELAIALTLESLRELKEKFQTVRRWPGESSNTTYLTGRYSLPEKLSGIAGRFIKAFKADLERRPYPKAKPNRH